MLSEELSGEPVTISEIVNENQIAADARQKSMPFFLISFFSLTMSVFIIYSSYKVITLDRLPIIGTFRSIGATQKTVTRILILESALYGCMGGIAGIPLGIVVLKLILRGMGNTLSECLQHTLCDLTSPNKSCSSFNIRLAPSCLYKFMAHPGLK